MTQSETMTPWPRRPQRLATGVTNELIERIVAGTFNPGEPLPPEPVLCENFGVSRTVVREAVKTLEATRMVTVQQGQGTTVRELADWDLLNPAVLATVVRHDEELAILDDLIDVRRALESQMAGQAAGRLGEADRELITERLDLLEKLVDKPDEYHAADVAFHDAILAASGNRLGRSIIVTLTEEAYRSIRYAGVPTPAECLLSNEAHRAICKAVLSGDPGLSEQLMNAHILEAWQRRRPRRGDVRP